MFGGRHTPLTETRRISHAPGIFYSYFPKPCYKQARQGETDSSQAFNATNGSLPSFACSFLRRAPSRHTTLTPKAVISQNYSIHGSRCAPLRKPGRHGNETRLYRGGSTSLGSEPRSIVVNRGHEEKSKRFVCSRRFLIIDQYGWPRVGCL